MSTVRIDGIPAEIRTKHFPNTSLQRYRYTNPLGFEVSQGCPQSSKKIIRRHDHFRIEHKLTFTITDAM